MNTKRIIMVIIYMNKINHITINNYKNLTFVSVNTLLICADVTLKTLKSRHCVKKKTQYNLASRATMDPSASGMAAQLKPTYLKAAGMGALTSIRQYGSISVKTLDTSAYATKQIIRVSMIDLGIDFDGFFASSPVVI